MLSKPFCGNLQAASEDIWKYKGPRIVKTMIKDEMEDFNYHKINMHNKVIITKMV